MNTLISKIELKASETYRKATSSIRMKPDFIIIGAQKGGTTTLYDYLIQNKCVTAAYKKEIHFFDNDFERGLSWYSSRFPTKLKRYWHQYKHENRLITGEASPYYIFHPLCPERIARTLPHVKLIVMLRNPIDRAYSHYQMNVRQGLESLSFETAIEVEQERIQGEQEKIINISNYTNPTYAKYSYLSRGIYINQIKKWSNFFPEEQFCILNSESFFQSPLKIIEKVANFLAIPTHEPKKFKKSNVGQYSPMKSQTRNYLKNFFEVHNHQLYEFLNNDFGWDI